MSKQAGWKDKFQRISALAQVPFAFLGQPAGPPPRQAGLPPTPLPRVRPAELAPSTHVPPTAKLYGKHKQREEKQRRAQAMADAGARQQTTSQRVDPVKPADHGEKRKQRAAVGGHGILPGDGQVAARWRT